MTARIYVDVQSLLDIRQSALIELMGKEKALEYVTSEAYGFRDLDEFPVDMEAFRALINDPSGQVFKNATVTYIEVVLRSKLDTLEKRNAFNQTSEMGEIILNIYPYRLSEDQANRLRDALFLKLGKVCKIVVVCESMAVWTPAYMKTMGIYAFISYSFSDWLNAHKDKLETTDLREIQLYFPAIGQKALEKDEIKQFSKLGFKDIFSYMEYILAAATKLSFLPPMFYTNIVTATAHMEKNKVNMLSPLTEEAGEKDGNISQPS